MQADFGRDKESTSEDEPMQDGGASAAPVADGAAEGDNDTVMAEAVPGDDKSDEDTAPVPRSVDAAVLALPRGRPESSPKLPDKLPDTYAAKDEIQVRDPFVYDTHGDRGGGDASERGDSNSSDIRRQSVKAERNSSQENMRMPAGFLFGNKGKDKGKGKGKNKGKDKGRQESYSSWDSWGGSSSSRGGWGGQSWWSSR